MTRPFILFGILLISTAAAAPNLPKQESPGNRIPRWQHYLNESDFQFQKEEACAVYSARQYRGAAKLHLINDSEKWWTGVTLRFGPDGNLLVLNSNWESVFEGEQQHIVLRFVLGQRQRVYDYCLRPQ